MGILSALGLAQGASVQATTGVWSTPSNYAWTSDGALAAVSRGEAMQVPAVARARNLIAGTIGTLPLWAYNDQTNERLHGRTLLKQADPAIPQSVTVAWTVEDLLMTGAAYWMILEVDAVDGRPRAARRIDPVRVGNQRNLQTGVIDFFTVDGREVPFSGVGSLIMFNGFDDGILARAGRTIRTALNLERAAMRMADEPVPSMVLKNTGVDLPPEQVTSLLAAWKQARQSRTTAYLGGNLDVHTFGYDAQSLQLVESRQHVATEIARTCNIPAWYLNADQTNMTYSNASQVRRDFVDFAIKPFCSVLEQRLSMDDITARGTVVRFSLEAFLRGNPNEEMDLVAKMLDYQIVTTDEARAMLDLAPRGNA